MRKKIVLFVSTGDTCRSPMAAGYFRKLLAERNVKGVEVRAAGVMTVTGLRASQEAQQVMEAVEVDLSRHRSSQLTPESIRRADLILGMSPLHVQHALRESPDARGKTFLLKEFARSDLKNIQISDPMGCTLEVFKKCFKEIRQACDKLIDTDYVKALIPAPDRDARPRMSTEPPAPKKSTSVRDLEDEAAPEPMKADESRAEVKPAVKTGAKTKAKPAAKTKNKAEAKPKAKATSKSRGSDAGKSAKKKVAAKSATATSKKTPAKKAKSPAPKKRAAASKK